MNITTYHFSLDICRKKIRLMFLLLLPVCLQAQNHKVTGMVSDENQKPVEVANVILINAADSSYVDAYITEPDGSFVLQSTPGEKLVYIRLIGYEEKYYPVKVNGNTHIGNLTLKSQSIGLEGVTVVAAKPIIRREIDRIVFDASNSPLAVGGSALEVLQDVPGLMVDPTHVSIIGKGAVKVYVNDKEVKLSGDDLTNYLRTFSSSDIENVEVYTVPPSRFEAAGNAGIINIRTKKRREDFFGGSVNSSYNYSQKNNYGYVGINLILNKNRISSFLNVSGMLGDMGYIERNEIHYSQSIWKNRNQTDYDYPTYTTEGGLDIRLNNNWNIGVQGRYNKIPDRNVKDKGRMDIFSLHSQQPDSFYLTTDRTKMDMEQKLLNVHLDKSLGQGKRMLWDADYLRYDRNNNNQMDSEGYDSNGTPKYGTALNYARDEQRAVDVYSSSLDFILPFSNFHLNTGARFSHSDTRNELHYEHSSIDLPQRDKFDYKESIYALYLDGEKKFSDRFTLKAGLRMEHTASNAYSHSEDQRDKRNYARLFPTLYMLYKSQQKHDLYLRFSNRIARPANNMINPFVMYTNPYNAYKGKPDLQPYYIYNTEVGYTFDGNLNFSLYYSQHKDEFSQLGNIDEETNSRFTQWDNFLSERTIGLTNSYTIRTEWIQTFIQHGVNYKKSKSDSELTDPENKGWQYYASFRSTLYFNSSKTFTGTISGNFSSKQKGAAYISDINYNLSAGVRYAMLNKKLNVSLTGSNLLISNYKGRGNSNGIPMYYNNTFQFTVLRLGVNYTFGVNLKSSKRNYSNEDLQRRL